MTAQLSATPVFKAFDNNGLPLAGGLLYTYVAGTTTPQPTYVDSTQTTQNTNPIVLNARGECALWLDPTLSYKLLLKDSVGNTIPGWPVDNIIGGLVLPTTFPGVITIGGSIASNGNLDVGNGAFALNLATPDKVPQIDVVNDNLPTDTSGIRICAYGATANGPVLHFVKMNGTAIAPSALTTGENLLSIGARGFDVSPTGSAIAIEGTATENWSSGHNGSKLDFEVCPNGSTTRSIILTVNAATGTPAVASTPVSGTHGLGVNAAALSFASLQLLIASVEAGVLGAAGTAAQIATDSQVGDVVLRADTAAVRINTNAGGTSAVVVASSGNVSCTNALGINGASPPAQLTGWGTPTGGSAVNNFPGGGPATLAQCSTAIAQIIATLKAFGLYGT